MSKTSNTVATVAACITGKGKAARLTAFDTIAEKAFNAENCKAQFLDTLRLVLGTSPSDALVSFARIEIIAGIAGMRMPANELKSFKGKTATEAARILYRDYAAPSVAVAGKVPTLRKGKTGWRSAVQQRIIRNAESRATTYLAELGANDAKTEKERNAAKPSRIAKGKPETRATGTVGKSEAPSHAELVAKPLDATGFAASMLNMISMAMQYDNKNAKVRPVEFGPVAEMLITLHKAALECDKALHARLAKQAA